jgi:quercetin dioxygenase-like cupin family protein
MKKLFPIIATLLVLAISGCAPSSPPQETSSTGPDPAVVDPDHYKVEFENDRVRVLRITYGPGEKSVMHEHPPDVAIFLTNLNIKFTFPDGRTEEVHGKAGETRWDAGGKHLPENLSDEPFEGILVEMK